MWHREQTTLALEHGEYPVSHLERPGNAGTLVYVHGVGCSVDDFAPAVDRPELEGYRLLALDLPGSGASPYPQRHVGISSLANLLHAFTEARQAEDFTLIAHSMGAVAALRYIQYFPGEAQRFVNVEGSNAVWSARQQFLARRVTAKSREAFLASGFDELVCAFARSPYLGFRKHAAILKDASPEAYYDYSLSLVEQADRGDLLKLYQYLPLPRLFVYGAENGDQSPQTPTLEAVGIETAAISASHHFPFYDNPDEYYAVLGRWLHQQTRHTTS